MYLILKSYSRLSLTDTPREPDQQTPPLCYYSKVPTSEIHTIIIKKFPITGFLPLRFRNAGMYTLRLTGCIYVHECMSAFMHNKVQVGRQAFVCGQAGRRVDIIIIDPSIPRRYIK